jgi:hypothetical protein
VGGFLGQTGKIGSVCPALQRCLRGVCSRRCPGRGRKKRATARRISRWLAMPFLILMAVAVAVHSGTVGAAVREADQLRWSVRELSDVAPTVASYFRVYEVWATDLRFVIEYSSSGGLKVRETPRPFRTFGRRDLVPVLEAAAIQDTGVARALAGAVASMVLPHIGTTDATTSYLVWPRKFGWGKVVWLTWPPPLPADAADPPVWIENLADPPIADTLKSWAAVVRCDSGLEDLYVLSLLGASPSGRAGPLLKSILDRNPECQAHLADWIIHGGLPIRERTWDLVMQLLPSLSRRPTVARDFHAVNILWHDIARRRRWPTRGDRPARLERLGGQFVHNVLSDSSADSILCSAGDPPRVSPLGAMDSYAGDGLGPFLRVCREFGRAEDSGNLERLLGRFESLLQDSSLVQDWDWMREKSQGGREHVIEKFMADRDSTLSAVRAKR